jgi:hypothetical protein
MKTILVPDSRKVLAITCLLAGGALSGCASSSGMGWLGDDGKTPEEVALLDSTDEIVSRSMWQGAGLGAAAGCGMGLLIGGDFGDCLIGIAGGAAVGAGAGYAVGSKNAAAAQAEYNEQAVIKQLAEQEGQLKEVEGNLHTVLADQGRRLDQMSSQLAASEISEADYARQYETMMDVRKEVAATLESEKQNREQFTLQIVAWQKEGFDTVEVAEKNSANLEKIDQLLALARQVEPSAL